MPIKHYLSIAGVILIIAVYWRYDYVVKDRDKALYNLKNTETALQLQINQNKEIVEDALKENANRITYLRQLEIANHEKQRLEKCIADKSCVATVRVRIPTKCPVSAANQTGDSTGATTAEAELDADAIRAYSVHAGAIARVEADLDLCINTLKAWN